MTTHTLTERYIAAAMRTVPDDQRADLAAELRASIDDQVDARVEAGADRESAERDVLDELGDPDRLAAGYTDRPLHLIGPRYFLDWKRLVVLLLWIVVPLAAFGIALGQTLAGSGFGEILGSAVGGAITVAIHLVFWTTLVFAIIERVPAVRPAPLPMPAMPALPGLRSPRAPQPFTRWTVDQLPEPRGRGAGIAEVVGGVIAVFASAAALLWDHFIGFVPGIPVSFFAPEIWPIAAMYALFILALDAMLLVIVHVVRRWTVPLAIASTVLTLALTIPALWLLVNGSLINPAFFPAVTGAAGDELTRVVTIVVGFAIAAIAIWDIVDTFLKAVRRD